MLICSWPIRFQTALVGEFCYCSGNLGTKSSGKCQFLVSRFSPFTWNSTFYAHSHPYDTHIKNHIQIKTSNKHYLSYLFPSLEHAEHTHTHIHTRFTWETLWWPCVARWVCERKGSTLQRTIHTLYTNMGIGSTMAEKQVWTNTRSTRDDA